MFANDLISFSTPLPDPYSDCPLGRHFVHSLCRRIFRGYVNSIIGLPIYGPIPAYISGGTASSLVMPPTHTIRVLFLYDSTESGSHPCKGDSPNYDDTARDSDKHNLFEVNKCGRRKVIQVDMEKSIEPWKMNFLMKNDKNASK